MVIYHLGILNQKTPVYNALIKSNMNDVLHPIPKRWSSEFMAALSKWLVDLGKISNLSNYQFVDFLNTKWEDRFLEEMITRILKLGNIVPSISLRHILRDLVSEIDQLSAL